MLVEPAPPKGARDIVLEANPDEAAKAEKRLAILLQSFRMSSASDLETTARNLATELAVVKKIQSAVHEALYYKKWQAYLEGANFESEILVRLAWLELGVPAPSVERIKSALTMDLVRVSRPKASTCPPVKLRRMTLQRIHSWLSHYEGGEIARIENVARGESRSHRERVARTIEESYSLTTEQTTEETESSQKTDRHELAREIESTQTRERRISVSASGKYGVIFEASASASYDDTSTDTKRTREAQTIVSEIIRSASRRIEIRVSEVRQLKTTQFFETSDSRDIASEKTVRFIYRWIDKVYRARMFRYGARVACEVYLADASGRLLTSLNAPAPVEFTELDSVTVKTLLSTWKKLVEKHDCQDLPVPPQSVDIIVNSGLGSSVGGTLGLASGMTPEQEGRLNRAIPADYECIKAELAASVQGGYYNFLIADVQAFTRVSDGRPIAETRTLPGNTTSLSAAWDGPHCTEIFARLTTRWQPQEAVVAAWANAARAHLSAQYKARINAVHARLRELSEPAIDALIRRSIHDAFMDSVGKSSEGTLERGLEWENLNYQPENDGPTSVPSAARAFLDVALLPARLAAFLCATRIRLDVPIRPAHMKSVLHFLFTGVPWQRPNPPAFDHPMYRSAIKAADAGEVLERSDGEAVGEAWTIRVPTDHIYVEEDAEATPPPKFLANDLTLLRHQVQYELKDQTAVRSALALLGFSPVIATPEDAPAWKDSVLRFQRFMNKEKLLVELEAELRNMPKDKKPVVCFLSAERKQLKEDGIPGHDTCLAIAVALELNRHGRWHILREWQRIQP